MEEVRLELVCGGRAGGEEGQTVHVSLSWTPGSVWAPCPAWVGRRGRRECRDKAVVGGAGPYHGGCRRALLLTRDLPRSKQSALVRPEPNTGKRPWAARGRQAETDKQVHVPLGNCGALGPAGARLPRGFPTALPARPLESEPQHREGASSHPATSRGRAADGTCPRSCRSSVTVGVRTQVSGPLPCPPRALSPPCPHQDRQSFI